MQCKCLSNPIMQMGFTADIFHFLLILSYSHNASEVTAGQHRQCYASKQIDIPRAEDRLKPEPLWRTAEWLMGKEELSQVLEQTVHGSRIQENFQNCKNRSQIQKGRRRNQRRMSGKVTRPELQKTDFNNLEMKAAISRVGPITWIYPELPALWLKQGFSTLALMTFWIG